MPSHTTGHTADPNGWHGTKRRGEQPWRSWCKSPTWKSIRRHRLSEEPGWRQCAIEGRKVTASHVDHVAPHVGRWAFLRYCRFVSVAALGVMLAFSASAQTGSESQTPSTTTLGSESQTPSAATPSPESQTPSTATPGAETKSKSPGTPTSSNPAVPEANPASETTQPRKAAAPEILIVVSKPAQSMTVTVDGHVRYRWRVSTGATHYSTPDGSYTPTGWSRP